MKKRNLKLINSLRVAFDLNEYESKILSFLMVKGKSSAGEIEKGSNVPQSRVYDTCESLERKGLVKIIESRPLPIFGKFRPRKFVALSFNTMLFNTKKRLREEAKEKLETIKSMEKQIKRR